ncbi:MAG: 3-methylcrotonyl-CoA carboxylase, partial [Cellvibrionaceae bacterium]|nr:3-methylcrotonyl-CoA carboxylase [Cellvibrionaceae bacterium]
QVEHPVTELITGTDLVAWQIKVAAGQTLPKKQEQISLNGHAMEVRLYAEDPRQNFLPQTGDVALWRAAEGDGLRCDHMLADGQVVSPHYDPMLAKMIAWGEDRADAGRRLKRMLNESALLGVENNRHFLAEVIDHPVFKDGGATTAFLADHFADDPSMAALVPDADDWALAALILEALSAGEHGTIGHWASFSHHSGNFKLGLGEQIAEIQQWSQANQQGVNTEVTIQLGDKAAQSVTLNNLQLHSIDNNRAVFSRDGVKQSCWYAQAGERLYLATAKGDLSFSDLSRQPSAGADQAGSGQLKAVMDGAIVDLKANPGDRVAKGDVIVIMEAMKMEHPIKADVDGVIESINVATGEQVKSKQLLVQINPAESE